RRCADHSLCAEQCRIQICTYTRRCRYLGPGGCGRKCGRLQAGKTSPGKMTGRLLCLLVVFSTLSAFGQHSEFHSFFTVLRNAAVKKDTTVLKTLIYPFRDEVEDMQAGLIKSILEGNPARNGDGAFSVGALDSLIARHLDKITPIEKELYKQLSGDPIFGKTIRGFSRKDISVMDYHDVRMILLKSEER